MKKIYAIFMLIYRIFSLTACSFENFLMETDDLVVAEKEDKEIAYWGAGIAATSFIPIFLK